MCMEGLSPQSALHGYTLCGPCLRVPLEKRAQAALSTKVPDFLMKGVLKIQRYWLLSLAFSAQHFHSVSKTKNIVMCVSISL